MIMIGEETPFEVAAREALLDAAMGPERTRKSSERLRAGRAPAEGLALSARVSDADGVVRLGGTVRLWHVEAGPGLPALLLGPLAVAPERQSDGIGGRLMREAIARARAAGHGAIILVGDPEYYQRFGFSAAHTGALAMPGPFEQRRLVALELIPGYLAGAHGMIAAAGEMLAPAAVVPAVAMEAHGVSPESAGLRWSAAELSVAA